MEKQVMFFDGGTCESVIESENLPEVVALDATSFASQKPDLLYSATAPRTIKVTTSGGRVTETTEMHEYHVVGNDWKIQRVKAADLKTGDRGKADQAWTGRNNKRYSKPR
jgi:hypothetical protein